jgi:PAS domain S-box-containing protein
MYRFKRACGTYRWVQDTGTPRFLSDGTFLGYIGSIIDIHDQKLREEQLQYQATLMDNVLDSVVTTDLNFNVRSWNKVAEEIYGFTPDAMGKRMPDLSHFKYIDSTKEDASRILKEKGVWQGEIDVTIQGRERNFLFTVTYVIGADGNRVGVMALGREITDRKQAEKRLRDSELFYRSLIADSLDGMLLTDVQGTITFVSPSIKPILGFEEDEILHKNAFEFVHPDDHALGMEAFLNEVSQTPVVRSVEIRILKKDGTWLWCMVRGNNLLTNPHVGSIVISLHDDSLRRKATDALRESEQRFRTLIRNLKLGVLLEDAEGGILMHNKATADILGLCETGFGAEDFHAIFQKAVHEDGSECRWEETPTQQAVQTKKTVNDAVIGIQKNGNVPEWTWLLVNANPVLDENGNVIHIITTFKDITERKKLVQEQINQQRLLTQATIDGQEQERKEIGKELHDNIGQQLTTTKLYLDMAKASGSEQCGKMVDRALKNISSIINEVRAMSHALVPSTLGDIGLIESVHELAESIQTVQNLQIDFQHYDFSEEHIPENGKLMLYRIIQEALNNIVKHAAATSVNINMVRTERMILLEVCDNGKGFLPEKARKGLGLTNIRNRAELFNGSVKIKTRPGEGCTVKVAIPYSGLARL